MDISGGLPYPTTQMLIYSEPCLIELLPAEWHKGNVYGLLLRGQVELTNLSRINKHIDVVLKSAKSQSDVLKLPGKATLAKMDGQIINLKNKINLPAYKEVHLTVKPE